MFVFKILTHPINKMILEHSFDKLVEDVWRYQLVNICTGEVLSKRLAGQVSDTAIQSQKWDGGIRLTVTLSIIPYISQSVFESNAALHAFVCSGDRKRGSGLSRLFAGEVQLDKIVVEHKQFLDRKIYSPRAPSTNNSCEQDLLRIICNIRTKHIDCSPIVTVRALYNVRLGHVRLEGAENHS